MNDNMIQRVAVQGRIYFPTAGVTFQNGRVVTFGFAPFGLNAARAELARLGVDVI